MMGDVTMSPLQVFGGTGKAISRRETGVQRSRQMKKIQREKMVKLLPWQQQKVHVRRGRSERKGKARLWKDGFVG